jgi:hypothetical protein
MLLVQAHRKRPRGTVQPTPQTCAKRQKPKVVVARVGAPGPCSSPAPSPSAAATATAAATAIAAREGAVRVHVVKETDAAAAARATTVTITGPADLVLAGVVTALDDARVFRPAAHLAPSDVEFVSGEAAHDRRRGFALHRFVLQMRSPVFAAMLESVGPPKAVVAREALGLDNDAAATGVRVSTPVELPEGGAELTLLFACLYSNDPNALLTKANVVRLCSLAHKYGCLELQRAAFALAKMLAKGATLVGTTPTLPELLVLGQVTQDTSLLDAVLQRGMDAFCAPAPGAASNSTSPPPARYAGRCPTHPRQPLPCAYKCPALAPPEVLDARGRRLLAKLNAATLVALVEALVAALVAKSPARALY